MICRCEASWRPNIGHSSRAVLYLRFEEALNFFRGRAAEENAREALIAAFCRREKSLSCSRKKGRLVGAVGIELKATLKTRKLLILLNEKNAKNIGFAQVRYTAGTRDNALTCHWSFLIRLPFFSTNERAAHSGKARDTRSYSPFAFCVCFSAAYASPRFRYKSGNTVDLKSFASIRNCFAKSPYCIAGKNIARNFSHSASSGTESYSGYIRRN